MQSSQYSSHSNAPKPRRIIGYTSDGDSINTGNSTKGNPNPMWESGYSYYYQNGHWYRTDGNSWWEWSTIFNWDLLGWNWHSGRTPTGNPT